MGEVECVTRFLKTWTLRSIAVNLLGLPIHSQLKQFEWAWGGRVEPSASTIFDSFYSLVSLPLLAKIPSSIYKVVSVLTSTPLTHVPCALVLILSFFW